MTKISLTKGTMIAAAAAAAVVLALAGAPAVAQKGAKMSAPPPPQPGFCTASVNAFKWGHLGWRTSTGHVVPTIGMCYDQYCPAQC